MYLVLSSITAGRPANVAQNDGDTAAPEPNRCRTEALKLAALRVASFAGVVALGALLTAVQLLPTLELSGLSFRSGGLPYREAASFSLRPQSLLQSLLPPYGSDLSQVFGESFSEYVAYVGILGLLLAATGWAFGRRHGRHTFGLLALVGVFLAFGAFNPAYYVLYRLVPGFALFRAPVRWLLLYHFGLSILVGFGADALLQADFGARVLAAARALRRNLSARGMAPAALISVAVLLVLAAFAYVAVRPARAMLPIWIAVLVVELGLISAAFRLRLPARAMQAGLAVLLLTELFVASRGLAYNNPTAPQAYEFLRTATAHLLTDPGLHRFISLSNTTYDPGDLQQIRDIYGPQLSARALYDYVISVKRNEVLAYNLPLRYGLQAVDGYDGGLLPLKRFVEMEGLFLPPDLVSPDGRLREQLTQVPDSRLLSLLNVKYIITDKVYDVWVDNVFYDLQFTAHLNEARPEIATSDVPDDPADALGVISYLQGCADVADGTPVAEIVTVDDRGATARYVLRAGQETAEGDYSAAPVRHAPARVGHHWRDDPSGNDYVAMFDFDGPRIIRQVTVRSLLPSGEFDLRGLSLVDRRTQSNRTVLLSTSGHFRLVHSGDVKIYENLDNLPRAFVVHDVRVIGDDAAAIDAMRQPDFDPARTVILPAPDASVTSVRPAGDAAAPRGGDRAEVDTYEPERVVINTQSAADGYLVLADSYYPCWEATVDGKTTPILRANLMFRAVELPAGEHRVEFFYRPHVIRIGAEISGATALLLIVVGIGLAIRRKRRKA